MPLGGWTAWNEVWTCTSLSSSKKWMESSARCRCFMVFFIMACVISCFFIPFHQFPHCLWLDSKLSKMGIEVWTLDFTNSTIRGSIGKLMQHIAGHSHCALIRQTGNVCYCSSHSSIWLANLLHQLWNVFQELRLKAANSANTPLLAEQGGGALLWAKSSSAVQEAGLGRLGRVGLFHSPVWNANGLLGKVPETSPSSVVGFCLGCCAHLNLGCVWHRWRVVCLFSLSPVPRFICVKCWLAFAATSLRPASYAKAGSRCVYRWRLMVQNTINGQWTSRGLLSLLDWELRDNRNWTPPLASWLWLLLCFPLFLA